MMVKAALGKLPVAARQDAGKERKGKGGSQATIGCDDESLNGKKELRRFSNFIRMALLCQDL